ncbi:T9SS type A sorting domain-containing protein [Prevotella sp. HUN102]|uniref:T9SS type A sorting domain-containing protein n=1 Tax=Prevotella sp. HUN102 TaxID=1392486 RepID=UPI00048BD8F7|nr:choice-of-anchor J domain-containing protein [Prevotella sp. HUN102]
MRKKFLPFYASCLMATAAVGGLALVPQTVMAQAKAPSMSIETPSLTRAEGKVGETIVMATFNITTENTTMPVTLRTAGTQGKFFEVSPTMIPAGSATTPVTISYKPTAIGSHKANLMIETDEMPTLSQMIKLEGIAIDPDNPPTVTMTSSPLAAFNAQVGKKHEQTMKFNTKNMAENTIVTLAKKNKVFKLSTSSIYKNYPGTIRVSFEPTSEGEFKDTIIVSSYGLTEQRYPISGTATPAATVEEKEGVDISTLSAENPLKLLNENFNTVEKNKPIALDRWTNVALAGTRAWWGYKFPEYDAEPNEITAKVTPFDSKVEPGNESDCKMMLITPPLDFVNSASKMMTLRVRGDYLQNNMKDHFGVYLLDFQNDTLYSQELSGFNLPDTEDEKGEWNEYHVDLSGQKVNGGVFFIGFGFASKRGVSNSATYYIDDVTYGRTDLPLLKPSATELAYTATLNKECISDEITIETENITQDIKLTVGGPNKSKFKVSTPTLTKDGGKFRVSFKSDKVGVHQAYVKIASRGAADKYIALSVNNTEATGIESLNADENLGAVATVFDITGKQVLTTYNVTFGDLKSQLAPGIYVISSGNTTKKVVVE